MKTIPLTQGKVALVDDADYERVNKYKWYAARNHKTWYAQRRVRNDPKRKTIIMHGYILGWFKGIDHINGDGLDNRRKNLRRSSHSTNSQNKQGRGRSKFIGVCWLAKRRRWVARIKVMGVRKYLGHFTEEVDAAIAYDKAVLKERAGYVRTNILPCPANRRGKQI